MIRKLTIEIDAGERTCDGCKKQKPVCDEWANGDTCSIFDKDLIFSHKHSVYKRRPECLAAEQCVDNTHRFEFDTGHVESTDPILEGEDTFATPEQYREAKKTINDTQKRLYQQAEKAVNQMTKTDREICEAANVDPTPIGDVEAYCQRFTRSRVLSMLDTIAAKDEEIAKLKSRCEEFEKQLMSNSHTQNIIQGKSDD